MVFLYIPIEVCTKWPSMISQFKKTAIVLFPEIHSRYTLTASQTDVTLTIFNKHWLDIGTASGTEPSILAPSRPTLVGKFRSFSESEWRQNNTLSTHTPITRPAREANAWQHVADITRKLHMIRAFHTNKSTGAKTRYSRPLSLRGYVIEAATTTNQPTRTLLVDNKHIENTRHAHKRGGGSMGERLVCTYPMQTSSVSAKQRVCCCIEHARPPA